MVAIVPSVPPAGKPSDVQSRRVRPYDAFISYSHAQSADVAEALQFELERFAKPWYRQRQLKVFRDESSLAADPGLWLSIESALDLSRWFILVASPKAAQSPWVQREVEWWVNNRSTRSMLIAQTGGEIVWLDKDFDWIRTTA